MDNVFDMNDFVGAGQGDKKHMLGKFLYFSLANLLVEKERLSKLCEDMGVPYAGGTRVSVSDAFRSATGDIRERIPVTSTGETNIYLAYCRDNKRVSDVLSRELVKETLNQKTNNYEKLANISYDKQDGVFRAENLVPDPHVDVPGCCRRAEELFELYQRCANRKQIGAICVNYLRGLEATKLSITGHMYFVPRTHMDKVSVFEDFITLMGSFNQKDIPLAVNSFHLAGSDGVANDCNGDAVSRQRRAYAGSRPSAWLGRKRIWQTDCWGGRAETDRIRSGIPEAAERP